jgi:hypothetical protein
MSDFKYPTKNATIIVLIMFPNKLKKISKKQLNNKKPRQKAGVKLKRRVENETIGSL